MASVSSTSNSLNSLYNTYGNSNSITGLASGMDTETMIEQAVSGFQKKIEALQQKQTLLQWKQAEMRSFITMLTNLNDNYASYRSKTNLFSPSFFTGALTSSAIGANADKISASGGSNSSIAINSVTRLATAATCQIDAGALYDKADGTGEKIDWENLDLNKVAGRRITVTLDGVTKSIQIADIATSLGNIKSTDKLAEALQTQLDKAFGEGRVTVSDKNGALSFSAKGSTLQAVADVPGLGLGSGVTNYIDTAKTKALDVLCQNNGDGTYTCNGKTYFEDQEGTLRDNQGKALTLTINGTKIAVSTDTSVAGLIANINNAGAGVTASYSQLTNKFTFTAKETGAGSKIEFGGVLGNVLQPDNSPSTVNAASLFGDLKWDENGNAAINLYNGGIWFGDFTLNKDDTIQQMAKKIEKIGEENGYPDLFKGMFQYDSESGTYSLDDKWKDISFTQEESGTKISMPELVGDINSRGPVYTEGQDAELTVTINGEQMTVIRSSNTIDLDGLSVTLKGTFNVDGEGEPVTFTSEVDTENIVSAVKSFVEDYNTLMKAIREAYATQPLEKSSSTHTKYEPLTDAEKEGLSDKAIEEYEQKARTGMFFMDGDLSALYSRMNSILSANRGALAEAGISIEYDSNSRTNFLQLDEDKLASALRSDASKVAAVFAGKDGEGGLMSEVQSMVTDYASTSTGAYGILVRKSGATESAISQRAENNTYQKQIESLEDQIDKWKSKISTKIDYYSRQFSMLEQLMGTYNNQSSMLMSMMGGY